MHSIHFSLQPLKVLQVALSTGLSQGQTMIEEISLGHESRASIEDETAGYFDVYEETVLEPGKTAPHSAKQDPSKRH